RARSQGSAASAKGAWSQQVALLIAEQQDTQRGWYLLLMRAAGQRHAQPKQTAKQREYRGERQLPAPRPGRRSASPPPQQQYVPSLPLEGPGVAAETIG